MLVTQATRILGAKPPTKLYPRLMGPFVIVTSIKDTYTCRNRVTEDNKDFHVSRLREFHYQQEFVNPKDVAMRDNEEFVVDSIQEHRGDVTRLTSLEFRIRWLGYDATHNTWEPWKGFHNSHKELRHPLFQVGLKEGTAAEKHVEAFASSDFMESGTLGGWPSLPEDEEYIPPRSHR